MNIVSGNCEMAYVLGQFSKMNSFTNCHCNVRNSRQDFTLVCNISVFFFL